MRARDIAKDPMRVTLQRSAMQRTFFQMLFLALGFGGLCFPARVLANTNTCGAPRPTPPGPTVYIEDLQLVAPGEGTVSVKVSTGGHPIAATQNRINFCGGATIRRRANGRPDCAANPEIDNAAVSFRFEPPECTGENCAGITGLFLLTENTVPFYDGQIVYTCNVSVTESSYLEAADVISLRDLSGTTINAAQSQGSRICVQTAPAPRSHACVGDCDLDGGVTINDLIKMVAVVLGMSPAQSCVQSASEDGAITVDRVLLGVEHGLAGCPRCDQ